VFQMIFYKNLLDEKVNQVSL